MIKRIIYGILFCLLLGGLGCSRKSAMPDLKESYSAKDTKPFGTWVAYRILSNSFPGNFIQRTNMPLSTSGAFTYNNHSLYVCITKNFWPEAKDVDALLDYVSQGNSFFLSAANIDSMLLDKLSAEIQQPSYIDHISPTSYQQTSVRLIEEANRPKDSFSYFYNPFGRHFLKLNEFSSRIVGYNGDGKVNCMVYFWGKGKIFLHTEPRAFSNYFLLTRNNYGYMRQLMQLMNSNPLHVYWDDYYNRQNNRSGKSAFSTFSELLKYPPLATAFWLSLLMLLLYVSFGGKRRQRIIPQIKPIQNSSVAFTEAIARLYLQQKDNKNIADKMITYFNEHVRTHYFLSGIPGSADFMLALSRKSGVPLEKTTSLYRAIEHASENGEIDDYQLLSLNEQIQSFYKK